VGDPVLIDSYNENIALLGGLLMRKRMSLFSTLRDRAVEVHSRLEERLSFDMAYIASWEEGDGSGGAGGPGGPGDGGGGPGGADKGGNSTGGTSGESAAAEGSDLSQRIRLAQAEAREEEARRETSVVGPHRDRIAIRVGGRDARRFASQGQSRTAVLAMKLAEAQVVKDLVGKSPILLLDDVMSELDGGHRDALLRCVADAAQTVMSTTSTEGIPVELLASSKVVRLG
jgi:DNA replication and repair protein RecF